MSGIVGLVACLWMGPAVLVGRVEVNEEVLRREGGRGKGHLGGEENPDVHVLEPVSFLGGREWSAPRVVERMAGTIWPEQE